LDKGMRVLTPVALSLLQKIDGQQSGFVSFLVPGHVIFCYTA